MTECLPDMPRYIRQNHAGGWEGADQPGGRWWPITAPQSGMPWPVPSVAEQSSVVHLTDADRLALALCRNRSDGGDLCLTPCKFCRRASADHSAELAQIHRERHGGSSQVADWLDGLGTHP